MCAKRTRNLFASSQGDTELEKGPEQLRKDDPRRVTLLDTNVIDAQYRVGNDQVRARNLILSSVTDAA
ncbi:MAG: hypothetical protein DMF00_07015 [Verrucomicrobia bacterium]|nr:MAG: hypothetical protein DMF00_07015 [Verrucomicrobiota bacterium]